MYHVQCTRHGVQGVQCVQCSRFTVRNGCMLYNVYFIQGVHFTGCTLYSVYSRLQATYPKELSSQPSVV